ncbi:hypothetical protein [Paenibacillus periandrae]|uniref:hypothetical protein n=1 Tax=Paenibacillus periandrae TaxID=1761741 RepID=UPI001F09EF34|nr:hypothetical protein [Paenibacillus periandrae]
MEIKAGMRVWSSVFECNVDVIRVYKHSVTIQTWGRGLKEGKLMTFRGQSIESLQPMRKRAC